MVTPKFEPARVGQVGREVMIDAPSSLTIDIITCAYEHALLSFPPNCPCMGEYPCVKYVFLKFDRTCAFRGMKQILAQAANLSAVMHHAPCTSTEYDGAHPLTVASVTA